MTAPVRRSIHVEGLAHGTQPIPNASVMGDLLVSGAIYGKEPATGTVPDDLDAEIAQAFSNLRAVLEAAGGSLENVVKVAVSVRERSVREHLNAAWVEAFPNPESRPARHTVEAPMTGMRLQFEVIAVLPV